VLHRAPYAFTPVFPSSFRCEAAASLSILTPIANCECAIITMAQASREEPGSPRVQFTAIAPQTPIIIVGGDDPSTVRPIEQAALPSTPGTPGSASDRQPESASSDRQRRATSRDNSYRNTLLYTQGDFRNSSMPDLRDLKADMMCNWLHQQ
jgi:hypothetical protein